MSQHAVLVDAGLVGERVPAHDRLVRLHDVARQARDHARGAGDLLGVDVRAQAVARSAGREQHHDLLERGVAGPLADAIDGRLDLAGARHHAGQRVGDRQAQVVVAVHREHDAVDLRHPPAQPVQDLDVLLGDGVADGVGDVDRGRAGGDGRAHDLGHELGVAAGRVLARELDVAAERLRLADGAVGRRDHLGAGGDEDVDARVARALERLDGRLDVLVVRARERRDDAVDGLGDGADALPLSRRGDGEPGLDDVHAEPVELACDLDLLGRRQRDSGRLLAVAERGIEDADGVRGCCHQLDPPRLGESAALPSGLGCVCAVSRRVGQVVRPSGRE